jgi:hypothetical protein
MELTNGSFALSLAFVCGVIPALLTLFSIKFLRFYSVPTDKKIAFRKQFELLSLDSNVKLLEAIVATTPIGTIALILAAGAIDAEAVDDKVWLVKAVALGSVTFQVFMMSLLFLARRRKVIRNLELKS